MTQNYLLTEDDGAPIGFVDLNSITTEGTRLAFAFAAHCGDSARLEAIGAATLAKVGSEMFGFVCANALRVLAEEILDPTWTVAEAAGVNGIREKMLEISEANQ